MEGKVTLFECSDKTGKRPHFKGYFTINGEDHEWAVWPARSGKGFSGSYKPKTMKQPTKEVMDKIYESEAKPAQAKAAPIQDDEIPF